MPRFSSQSQARLSQCDPRIQEIMNEAILSFDFSVLTGHRGKTEQDAMRSKGRSQLSYPNSRHNSLPSQAIDIAPWPIDWQDRERFTLLAGFILGIAQAKGISLRWGGDWNRNWEVKDNKFDDLPHFELTDSRPSSFINWSTQ